jgi:hypothetical protein
METTMVVLEYDRWDIEFATRSLRNQAAALEKDKITFDEFALGMASHLVATDPVYLEAHIALIPKHLLVRLSAFYRTYLESVNFMPDLVVHFMLRPHTQKDVDDAKELFRPRFLSLMKYVEKGATAEAN